MSINPILKEMGFSKDDKVLVIHADDVGINHSSIDAFEELTDLGTISCGSAMVPTSWFPEVVKRLENHPEWDLGLHLAFNGEYETYKWRPISTNSLESGFVDENGYFIQDKVQVQQTANPVFIEKEIEAQIRVAKSLGLNPTHVDTHTGTLWNKKYMDSYVNVFKNHGILPVLFNPKEENPMIQTLVDSFNIDKAKLSALEKNGFPLVDGISGLPVEHTYDIEERFELAKHILGTVEPGKLIHFAFHPMTDTLESRALNRYTGGRIGDFEVFRKKELKTFLENQGIQLIGYREISEQIKKMKLTATYY